VTALIDLGARASTQGRYDEADYHLGRALELAEEIDYRVEIARALWNLGWNAFDQGEGAKAQRYAEDSLATWEEIGNRFQIGQVIRLLAAVASLRGEYGECKRYLEEGLAICEEVGHREGIAGCLNDLGEGARRQGKYAEAVRYYEESLAIRRELGLPAAMLLNNLGHAYIGLDKDDLGWRYLREALKESLTVGRVPIRLEIFVGVAWLQEKAGRHKLAAELLGLVLGHPALNEDTRWYAEPVLAMVRDSLPADELEAALARGEALDLDATVAELLER
jgi:tetratricopeptide (TPR) repeat protein